MAGFNKLMSAVTAGLEAGTVTFCSEAFDTKSQQRRSP